MSERPPKSLERPRDSEFAGFAQAAGESRNLARRRITLAIVLLFWIGQFGANTLISQINSPETAQASLFPRSIVCALGFLISIAAIALQDRGRGKPLAVRAYWALGFTMLSSLALSACNRVLFDTLAGFRGTSSYWSTLPFDALPRLWIFGSVYAMALAISYAIDVRDREREIAALRALAQDAHLRALRSQLQPHFLFNALNSIAALIGEGRAAEAEAVTEDLSDFLRTTLALDPQRQIAVVQEVALQQTFLDIQKVRFPTRMNVIVEIAHDARKALVPNLILQPLVENSVKHAVARSTTPVTIRIAAAISRDRLRMTVEDDGGNAGDSSLPVGTRTGLANVEERLSALYGGSANFRFERNPQGGARNVIDLPFATED